MDFSLNKLKRTYDTINKSAFSLDNTWTIFFEIFFSNPHTFESLKGG